MRVMIGTPSIDGKLDVHYFYSIKDTIFEGIKRGIEIIPIMICYDSLLVRARNDIFETAYKNKLDQLFFIDADMGWTVDDFFKLVDSDKHFIGAPVIKKSNQNIYNVKAIFNGKNPKLDHDNNVLEVSGIGTGFLRIDNYVINKMWKKTKSYFDNNIEKKQVFNITYENEIIGEDISFCNLWKSLNEKIYIDISINPLHIGNNVYKGDFREFINKIRS